MDILLFIIGALLPILSFLFQYYFSKNAGTYESFKNHTMVFYGDWLLIPFAALALSFSDLKYFMLSLLVSLPISYVVHRTWAKDQDPTAKHFFDSTFKKLSLAGVTHFFFTAIIISLIVSFSFSVSNPELIAQYASLSLLTFAIGMIVSSYRMHKRIVAVDFVVASALILLSLVKLFL